MKVAFILPAHNEEDILERSVCELDCWAEARFGSEGYVIVISENGSTDLTRKKAAGLAKRMAAVALLGSSHAGKGGALKWGLTAARADMYVLMDVDLSVHLDSVGDLIDRAAEGADIAIASRRMEGSAVERPLLRRMITAGYALVANSLVGLGVRDAQCGCKVLTRGTRDDLIPFVHDDGFFFDTELLAKARQGGLSIAELPVRWTERGDEAGKSKVKILKTSLRFLEKLRKLRKEIRS